MVILFGVLDLGRVYFSMITLTSSAREGARYLTLHSDDISNPLGVFRDTKLIAVKEANYAGINISTDQVSVTCANVDDEPNNCDGGKPAIITITQNFELILGWVLPSPITITRSAEMMVP